MLTLDSPVKRLLLPLATDKKLKTLAISHGLSWDFANGCAPLWLSGNWPEPKNVRLVLLMAEPSTPDPGETYSNDPEQWFRKAVDAPADAGRFREVHQHRGFQKKLEWFLEECGFDLDDNEGTWRQIIVSNTFWLRLPDKFGQAPTPVEDYFIAEYLIPLLGEFSNAIIVGAGGKAQKRLNKTGFSFVPVGALAPPGCYQKKVVEGHRLAAKLIKAHIARSRS